MKSKGRKDLSTELKSKIAQFLLQESKDGKPLRGRMLEAAKKFDVGQRSVTRIWSIAKSRLESDSLLSFSSKRMGVVHRKSTATLDCGRLVTIPFENRSTIRRLAKAMEVSKSSAHRWVKRGMLKAHTNAIKPDLTAQNKLLRFKFSLSALAVDRLVNKVKFKNMHNVIHIDEKWFYITKECERYYIAQEEIEPHRTCKSKRFITKVMFMCAVGRPLYSSEGAILFDGKVGMYPFTKDVPAERNSKNRVKGTLETKPIQSITKEVIKNCLITQIIPSIKAKWPANASKDIWIQQDNTKPHISNNDFDFVSAGTTDGFNIKLICQPANSPYTNVNDLGWFRALQSLQVETSSCTVDDLVKNVLKSYDNLTDITLNKVFLSLQSCLVEIIRVRGGNNYKLPHMKKDHLIREGRLPVCIEVDEMLVRECIEYLQVESNDCGNVYDVGDLMSELGYDLSF